MRTEIDIVKAINSLDFCTNHIELKIIVKPLLKDVIFLFE